MNNLEKISDYLTWGLVSLLLLVAAISSIGSLKTIELPEKKCFSVTRWNVDQYLSNPKNYCVSGTNGIYRVCKCKNNK